MSADIDKTQGLGTRDQLAENPPAPRQIPDPVTGVRIDPGRYEPVKLRTRLVKHAKRRVPRARHLPGGLDDALKQQVQIEVRQNPPRDLQHPQHAGSDR